MRSLGLDMSATATGCVVLEYGTSIESPITILEECELKAGKNMRGLERAGELASEMLKVIKITCPQIVMIEGYGYANSHSLATIVEVSTVMRYFIWQMGLSAFLVAPGQLKKYATGQGNSPKDRVMMALYKTWGFEAKTNNTADAFILALMGLGRRGFLTQSEARTALCTAAAPLV